MKDDVIQNQIRLVGFKAPHVEFNALENTSKNKSSQQPKFEIKLSDALVEESPNLFVKVFHINVEAHLEYDILKINVEYHTVFECNNKIDNVFLETDFAKISAPAIGFPFVRSFISTLTLQGGFPPIIIPSINFIQFAKENPVAKAKL